MTAIFTIDVEDWFHILDIDSAPSLSEWAALPSRVERNFYRLVDLLSETGVHATCFFLGWIAERYPHLVREAQVRGHEIASHSYAHRLVYGLTPEEFRADAVKAREILEQIAGVRVHGYRAPGFSVTRQTPWFHAELLAAGHSYDASVFPATRGHGGMAGAPKTAYVAAAAAAGNSLLAFPQSVAELLGRRVCFFGGGYLRVTPLAMIRRMGDQVLKQGRPLIFYIHPRDIDPDQPRLTMPPGRRFKSYVNLKSTEEKLRSILRAYPMVRFEELRAQLDITGLPAAHSAASGK